ncbi:serine protease [Streptomyces sp. NPDC060275]|uniref:S1 family peptidase n=1 Tax=Streptomyces sp. NPDC060275 TaxID=3347090 RepID=UPI003656EF62
MYGNSELEERAWLARICDATSGEVRGAGFAADGRHVITAAHVVRAAGVSAPGGRVHVVFPLLPGAGCEAVVLDDGWGSDGGGDQAVLQLLEPQTGIVPPRFEAVRSLDGHGFTAYGFPEGYVNSVAVTGRAGKAASLEWVTLTVDNSLHITAGFSGAAVWSDQCDAVVGMIVTQHRRGDGRVGFAVPLLHMAGRSALLAQVLEQGAKSAGVSGSGGSDGVQGPGHVDGAKAPGGRLHAGPDQPARAGGERDDESGGAVLLRAARVEEQRAQIKLAYDRLEALGELDLPPASRVAVQAVRTRLDDIAVDLLRGDGSDASAETVATVMTDITALHTVARPLLRPMSPGLTPTVSGAALVITFVDAQSVMARRPHVIIERCLAMADELHQTTGRKATFSCTGTTLLLVLEARRPDVGQSMRALFAAAMSLHWLAIGQDCRIASILTHGDDLVHLRPECQPSDTVSGRTVIEAALLLESCTSPGFLITADGFPLLRGSTALRAGTGQSASVLAGVCKPYFALDDLFEPPAASAVRFDCTMIPARAEVPHLSAYSLRLFASDGDGPVVGAPTRHGWPVVYERSTVHEGPASDRAFVTELATADRIEIVGTTNYRLADFLDRAWAIRSARGLGPWQELSVYYAAESLLPLLDPQATDPTLRSQRRSASTKTVKMLLNSRSALALDRRISEFSFTVPFTGAKLGYGDRTRYKLALKFPGQQSSERTFFVVNPTSEFGQQATDVFRMLREHSRDLFEREVWLAKADTAAPATLAGLYSHQPEDPLLRMATALVILHAETAGQQRLLMQQRTVFNALDSAGRYSNLSARLLESDLCGLDPHAKLAVSSREDADEVVTTRIFRELDLHAPIPLPRRAYVLALIRECLSGLGLSVSPDRFVWHTECELAVNKKRLSFQIFSLELSRGPVDEVALITMLRPYSNMRFMGRAEIAEMAKDRPERLNTLLTHNLHQTFIPIYESLEVA